VPFGVPTSVASISAQFVANLACAATTVTISGEVQLQQPWTVCCMP
jgi:hypothetical protein